MSTTSKPVVITSIGFSQNPDAMSAMQAKIGDFTEIHFTVSFEGLRLHTLEFEHLLYGSDDDRLEFIDKYESVFKKATSHGSEVMDFISRVSIVAMTSTELYQSRVNDAHHTDGYMLLSNYLGPMLDEESELPWVLMVWDEETGELKLEQEVVA